MQELRENSEMLKTGQKNFFHQGAAVIDYLGLLMFILIALFLFQQYIVRGLSGKWKSAGDSIGVGRQYDPRDYGAQGTGGGTEDCFWDDEVGNWVDRKDVERLCDCTLPPEDPRYVPDCLNCKQTHISDDCAVN